MKKLLNTAAVVCAIGFGSNVQAQSATQRAVSVGIKYFECINPTSNKPCICFSEKDKARACPSCTEWVLKSTNNTAWVPTTEGAYGANLPNANYFADVIAESAYKVEYPMTADRRPVATTDFFANFAKYGWADVGALGTKQGSLAIWPGGAGFVTQDSSGRLKVLYTSAAKEGEIREEYLSVLTDLSRVMFLLPKSYLACIVETSIERIR